VFASSELEFARLARLRLGLGPISLAGLGPISLAERGWHRFDPLAAVCPKTHARLSGPPRTASLHRRRLLRGAAALHHPSHGSLRCIRCCAVASTHLRFRVVSPGNYPRSNSRAQVIPHANNEMQRIPAAIRPSPQVLFRALSSQTRPSQYDIRPIRVKSVPYPGDSDSAQRHEPAPQ
jgi:hypothetical protein